jgi:hypothetical protein
MQMRVDNDGIVISQHQHYQLEVIPYPLPLSTQSELLTENIGPSSSTASPGQIYAVKTNNTSTYAIFPHVEKASQR